MFSEVVGHIAALRKAKRRVILAGWTAGSADRLSQILTEHGLGNLRTVDTLADAEKLPAETAAMAVLPLETGFETERLAVIAEQDILGDRLVRRAKRKRAADFISEVASLSAGDIVGACRSRHRAFRGAERPSKRWARRMTAWKSAMRATIRLFLPVENIELLSRLRLGCGGRRARQAGRRRLAVAQGQAEAAGSSTWPAS